MKEILEFGTEILLGVWALTLTVLVFLNTVALLTMCYLGYFVGSVVIEAGEALLEFLEIALETGF